MVLPIIHSPPDLDLQLLIPPLLIAQLRLQVLTATFKLSHGHLLKLYVSPEFSDIILCLEDLYINLLILLINLIHLLLEMLILTDHPLMILLRDIPQIGYMPDLLLEILLIGLQHRHLVPQLIQFAVPPLEFFGLGCEVFGPASFPLLVQLLLLGELVLFYLEFGVQFGEFVAEAVVLRFVF